MKIVLYLLLLIGINNLNAQTQIIRSKYFDFNTKIDKNWKLVEPIIDGEYKFKFELRDNSESKGLKLKIFNNALIGTKSLDSVLIFSKQSILQAKRYNKLVVEDIIDFNGKEYYKLLFYMYPEQLPEYKLIYVTLIRKSKQYLTEVTYYYLLKLGDGWIMPPPDLEKLISNILIEVD